MLFSTGDISDRQLDRVRSPHRYYNAEYFIPATRAVIEDFACRILLVRRRSDMRWALPGGSMMPEESAQDCVERVVKLQTGLTPRDSAPFIVDSGKYVRFPGQPEVQMITFGFRIRNWTGDLETNTSETLDARWCNRRDAYDLLGYGHDDITTIEDHICTDYDSPVPADGGLVWVR